MNTRKYPRTLEEAFGPYARGPVVEPTDQMPKADAAVLWICCAAAAVVAVLAILNMLPGAGA